MRSSYFRPFAAFSLLCARSSAAVGCGHTEQEWQVQLDKNARLNARLDAERERADKQAKELSELATALEQAKQALEGLGLGPGGLEEAKQALEKERIAERKQATLEARLTGAKRALEQTLGSKSVTVVRRKHRLALIIPADTLFQPRNQQISKDGKDLLREVAGVLVAHPDLKAGTYQVAGHVNEFSGAKSGENWRLSLGRAESVLLFLSDPKGGNLPTAKLSAAGFADTEPLDAGDSDEAKKKNNRLEIVIRLVDAGE